MLNPNMWDICTIVKTQEAFESGLSRAACWERSRVQAPSLVQGVQTSAREIAKARGVQQRSEEFEPADKGQWSSNKGRWTSNLCIKARGVQQRSEDFKPADKGQWSSKKGQWTSNLCIKTRRVEVKVKGVQIKFAGDQIIT